MAQNSIFDSLNPYIEMMEKRGHKVKAARIVVDTYPKPKAILLHVGHTDEDFGHFLASCMNSKVEDVSGYGSQGLSKPCIDSRASFVWFDSGYWIEATVSEYDGAYSQGWTVRNMPDIHPDCL